MPIRAFRERIFQCICLEIGGFLLASPLFAWIFGMGIGESSLLIIAMTAVELAWNPMHDQVFDRIDWHFTRRPASSRPPWLRLVHAATHELSAMLVTLPALMLVGGLGVVEALVMDLGFGAFYAVYVLIFFWLYDQMWPVKLES